MATQHSDPVGILMIKKEAEGEDYDVAKSDLPRGGQTPAFVVCMDRADALHSCHYIKQETVVADLGISSVTPDSLTGNAGESVGKMEGIPKDHGEDNTETPDMFQSHVKWEIVKIFNQHSLATHVKKSDNEENACSFDDFSNSEMFTNHYFQTYPMDLTIKEEIVDNEYDMETQSNMTSVDSDDCDNQAESMASSDKATHLHVKENSGGYVSKNETLSDYAGNKDGKFHISTGKPDDAHDSLFTIPCHLKYNSQSKSVASGSMFQKKFEDYVASRIMTETYTPALGRELDKGVSDAQLQVITTGIQPHSSFTMCEHTQSGSPPYGDNIVDMPCGRNLGERLPLHSKRWGRNKQERTSKVYGCTECSTQFDCLKDLKAHASVHKRKYKRYSKLLKKMNSTTYSTASPAMFECENCSRSFTFATDLSKHLKSCHFKTWCQSSLMKCQRWGIPDVDLDVGRCKTCTASHQSQKTEETSANGEPQRCKVCGSLFPTVDALQIHMHHPQSPLVVTNSPLQTRSLSPNPSAQDYSTPTQISSRHGLASIPSSEQLKGKDGELENSATDGPEVDIGQDRDIPGESPNPVTSDTNQIKLEHFTSTGKKKGLKRPTTFHHKSPLQTNTEQEEDDIDTGTSKEKYTCNNHKIASIEKKRHKLKRGIVHNGSESNNEKCTGRTMLGSVHVQELCTAVHRSDNAGFEEASGDRQTVRHFSLKLDRQVQAVTNNAYQKETNCGNRQLTEVGNQACFYGKSITAEQHIFGIKVQENRSCYSHSAGLPSLCSLERPSNTAMNNPEAHCDVQHEVRAELFCASSPNGTDSQETVTMNKEPESPDSYDTFTSRRRTYDVPLMKSCTAGSSLLLGKRNLNTHDVNPFTTVTRADGLSSKESEANGPTRLSGQFRSCRVFTCRYCSSMFDSTQGLSAHQRVHIKTRPFNCNQCTQRFHTREHLQRHKMLHISNVLYMCVFCKAMFPTLKGLNIHVTKYRTGSVEGECCVTENSESPFRQNVPVLSSVICLPPQTSARLKLPLLTSALSFNWKHHDCGEGSSFSGTKAETSALEKQTGRRPSSAWISPTPLCFRDIAIAAPAGDRSHVPNKPVTGEESPPRETKQENKAAENQSTKQCPSHHWSATVKWQEMERHHRKGQPVRYEKNALEQGPEQNSSVCLDSFRSRCREAAQTQKRRKRNLCSPPKDAPQFTGIRQIKRSEAMNGTDQSTFHNHLPFDPCSRHKINPAETHCVLRDKTSVGKPATTESKASGGSDETSRVEMKAVGIDKVVSFKTPAHDTVYLCVDCHFSFPNKVSYDQHLYVQGSQQDPLTCFLCPQTFLCYRALEKHIDSHSSDGNASYSFLFERPLSATPPRAGNDGNAHDFAATSSAVSSLRCEFCGRAFLNGRGLWKHRESHNAEKRQKRRKKTSKPKAKRKGDEETPYFW